MDKEKLYILIGRYFEGDTSRDEEQELLKQLLAEPAGDAAIDEALAVMGYARTKPAKKGLAKRRLITASSAAAAVAAVLAVGAFLMPKHTEGECFAYIGGERVESEEIVRSLMADQLGEMSEASDEVARQVATDFDDFRDAFDFE